MRMTVPSFNFLRALLKRSGYEVCGTDKVGACKSFAGTLNIGITTVARLVTEFERSGHLTVTRRGSSEVVGFKLTSMGRALAEDDEEYQLAVVAHRPRHAELLRPGAANFMGRPLRTEISSCGPRVSVA